MTPVTPSLADPRSSRELLSAFPLFRSTDPEQVRTEVSRVFCPHQLEPVDPRRPLSTVHNLVKLGETALNFLTYGSDVMILPGSLDRFYLVQLPLTGSAQVTSGQESVESGACSAVILNPDERIRMRWSGESAQLLLWIPRRSIERRMTEVLGEGFKQPLRFSVELRQTSGMTSAWCTMLKDLARNIDENGVDWLRFRPAVSALEDCLIRGLIYQQPHSYSERLLKPALPAHSRQLQRALDYIEGAALESISVADIAQYAHLSVRALEEGFRKHYGTTPMNYLRGKRLDQARSAIVANALAGSPETITEIAFRHGFNHLGRFAAYYRERIGESPSDTARAAIG
ncbi:AraC family transcriptional regulator [Azoarcus sp. KH32C]|uniref:AraC family transcriptional regulator n=1 Tax=Azoarcus sp. KH32C TaxID=748247 RepID=UPI00023865F3|nr:AraC family transcriptional regulator [Azoarcus sp. KH32C]BAL24178.1 transcriptional regulator, AraC family [Azoarcus sp. KH32C]